ncbi:MAG TPA: sugar phosphate isomerase/epimerase family protein, partial [Gemmataceae bacterium]|nr:sugar phosphate isomerase/epimerase family protein [Gemmataceae bacterium]
MGELTPGNLTQTGRREITHLLRSHNLAPSAIYCPLRRGLDIAENLEPRLAHIRDTMALAFDLGPRLVVIPIGKVPEKEDDPAYALLKEALLDLGRHGDRTGVIVALDGVDNPASLATFLDRLDVGSLGVNFNPGQLVIAGQNPHDSIKTLGRRLIYAHAQDARRVSPGRMGMVPLGHGDLDWIQILADFEEVGYRGYLTVLADNQAEAAAGLAFLRRF